MTEATTLPADWAIERALDEGAYVVTTIADVKAKPIGHLPVIAFARYIEKHEKPPVDPWVLQARELAAAAKAGGYADRYRSGEYDGEPEVQAIAAALRAAYEKGKAE